MTTFRSKLTDGIGTFLLIVGFIGFSICWKIGWDAQERILTTNAFDRPAVGRSAAIEMKGRTFYVEPDYGRRFRLADNLIFPFWGIAAVGMGLRQREKIRQWWKQRRQRGVTYR
jgi:hypothetical protein